MDLKELLQKNKISTKLNENKYEIKNESGDEAELLIYGIVGDYWDELDAKTMVDKIKRITAKKINVKIMSDGGSVFVGLSIYNTLKEHEAEIIVTIDALAASIASVIAMAGDKVRMPENSFIMIHNPWTMAIGESDDLRKTADVLDKIKESISKVYQNKTGLTADEINEMMNDETWLNAEEAVTFGFADEIITDAKAELNSLFIFNHLRNLDKVPEPLKKELQAKLEGQQGENILKEVQKLIDQNNKTIESKINSLKIKGGDTLDTKPKEELTPEELRKIENEKIDKFAKERFDGKYKNFAEKAKASGLTYDQFAAMVFDKIEEQKSEYETPLSFMDMNEKDLKLFRISNAVKIVMEGKHKGLPESENASLEFEISNAIAKKIGQNPSNGTLYLPYDIRLKYVSSKFQNAHSTADGSGGEFIQTGVRPDLMPEVLRNDLALGRLGATIITGLRDNLTIPKIVTSLTAEAVAENNEATVSYITTGSLSATPHTVTANTEYGKQWFTQSSLDVDMMLMNELEAQKNVKVDYLALNGSGVSNEPTGFLNLSGITDISMAAPTWAKLLSFGKTIKEANAYRGSFKWLMSPSVEAEAKATEKFATTGRTFLENNQIDGMDYEWSNQIGDQVLALANWAEAYMLFWGAEELLIDPYTKSTKAMVRLSIFTMFDFLFRQTQAAAIADDYALS